MTVSHVSNMKKKNITVGYLISLKKNTLAHNLYYDLAYITEGVPVSSKRQTPQWYLSLPFQRNVPKVEFYYFQINLNESKYQWLNNRPTSCFQCVRAPGHLPLLTRPYSEDASFDSATWHR